jgi:hypothetical protein
MEYKYSTEVVIKAIEAYLADNKKPENDDIDIDYEDMFRIYETLVRVSTPPQAVILNEFELDILYKYL